VCMKWRKWNPLTWEQKIMNKILSSTRCIVEHVFGVIKHQWWHRKARYRWLRKNRLQRVMLCGLQNIYRVRRKLMAF
jgi:IS5 family transposase